MTARHDGQTWQSDIGVLKDSQPRHIFMTVRRDIHKRNPYVRANHKRKTWHLDKTSRYVIQACEDFFDWIEQHKVVFLSEL